jgi:hypothetical protein
MNTQSAYSFVFSAYVGTPEQLAATLRDEARAQVAQYPQYQNGYFEMFELGRLARTVRTKMGLQGEAGDLVLFRVERADEPGYDPRIPVTFWSRRTGCAVAVDGATVKAVVR